MTQGPPRDAKAIGTENRPTPPATSARASRVGVQRVYSPPCCGLIEHEWNIEEVHSRTISLHAETAADALAIARSRPRSDWEKVTACTEYRISDGRGDFVAEVTVERRGQPEWRMEEHG